MISSYSLLVILPVLDRVLQKRREQEDRKDPALGTEDAALSVAAGSEKMAAVVSFVRPAGDTN